MSKTVKFQLTPLVYICIYMYIYVYIWFRLHIANLSQEIIARCKIKLNVNSELKLHFQVIKSNDNNNYI